MENKNKVINNDDKNIKVVDYITKIQKYKPTYQSDVIDSEMGEGTILNDQFINKCVCSDRSNSDLFNRISPQFTNCITAGINQMIIFSGIETHARLITSFGIDKNPGLYLMVAITLLDLKYKAKQSTYLYLSFLQCENGCILDLLNYTQIPLKPKKTIGSNFIQFGQAQIKISTFGQFIKLLKVAVFNNKQRDVGKNLETQGTIKTQSTFIMKIVMKKYRDNGELLQKQENWFVDLETGGAVRENIGEIKNSQSKERWGNSRNIWDYLLIELYNCNPNHRSMHYHLVQQNHLLLILKRYIPSVNESVCGITCIINSISNRKDILKANLNQISALQNAFGTLWYSSIIIIYPQLNFQQSTIQKIIDNFQINFNQKYFCSFLELKNFQQKFIFQLEKHKNTIKKYLNLCQSFLKIKISKQICINTLIQSELILIGSCVKSDHYSSFYKAKSFVCLNRQVNIKTQSIKQQQQQIQSKIQTLSKQYDGLRDKQMRKKSIYLKQIEYFNKLKSTQNLQTINKEITVKEIYFNVLMFIIDAYQKVWKKLQIYNQKTVADMILFGEILQNQAEKMIRKLSILDQKISQLKLRFKSSLKQITENFHKQNNQRKKQKKTENIIKQNSYSTENIVKKYENKFSKLPLQLKQSNKCIIITGKIKLSKLLLNPTKKQNSEFYNEIQNQ